MKKILEMDALNVGFIVNKQCVSVVHDLSLDIYENEVLAIIGETGCGKSVTGNAVLHLLPDNAVTTGKIYFDGDIDILARSDEEYRPLRGDRIMTIPQSPVTSLDPLMCVGRQVSECVSGNRKNRNSKSNEIKGRVLDIFRKLHLPREEWIYDHFPCELSGGMCQRILIAMGVLTHPKLLVVDEPTKAIDWALRKDVVNMLMMLKAEMHCAMLLITHDIPLAAKLSDRVGVMYAGEIVELGDTDRVLSSPMHPYTKGLIASMPQNGFHSMKGFMPSFSNMAPGCRFHDRCPVRSNRCQVNMPPMHSLGGSHSVCCHCLGKMDQKEEIFYAGS